MKSQNLILAVLSLSLAACGGGDKPAPGTSTTGASSTGTAKPAEPSPTPKSTPAEQPQEPAKAPAKRVRIDPNMVKMLFGNETPAPKAEVASSEALVMLGDKLYHAEALSKKGNMSCNTCHDLGNYGVDNKQTSPGSDGSPGERNSPSTYNAFRQFAQFWDYREPSVEAQATGPMFNPIEHGVADEAELVAKIKAQPELVAGFEMAFGGDKEPINAKNFQTAIGAFERTLVTKSRWDQYLDTGKGLSNEELVGLDTFIKAGCIACHMNRTLGGQMAQKLGVTKPYTGADTGRMKVTGNEGDKYMFKVPMLLNVAKTAPYYHDGSIPTLEEAVSHMAELQTAKPLDKDEVAAIVTFLNALTGELPEKFAKK
ncbi:MAG: c-type cytochrome [Planctomycetes bacterium]|nr:c-type cytochrome [Planctomycetota bacterium]